VIERALRGRFVADPIGNGGLTSNYSWTQTLKDVTVNGDVGHILM